MKVNDKVNIKFQLDCGATCNILPLKQYVQAMGNPDDIYLQRSNATLTMYNGTVMHPVGNCKLTCVRDSSKQRICSAPEEFQRRMNTTFENLKGTAIIADDLLVFEEGDGIE